jgi:hypothetical protein
MGFGPAQPVVIAATRKHMRINFMRSFAGLFVTAGRCTCENQWITRDRLGLSVATRASWPDRYSRPRSARP